MSNKTKENDIVTELLDKAFNKPWEAFSPEEYKRQIEDTKARLDAATPSEKQKIMNKRFNLRGQATALYRKDYQKSKATSARYFQAFC